MMQEDDDDDDDVTGSGDHCVLVNENFDIICPFNKRKRYKATDKPADGRTKGKCRSTS